MKPGGEEDKIPENAKKHGFLIVAILPFWVISQLDGLPQSFGSSFS